MKACVPTKLLLIVSLLLSSFGVFGATKSKGLGSQILIGKVPGRYLKGKTNTKSHLASVTILKGVISEVKPIAASAVKGIQASAKLPVVVLKTGRKFDVIYPGLSDLHNHTKQNSLTVWGAAHGQFGNRFEWRKWNRYTSAVSLNMNPWIGEYGKVVNCAAFRWSELQAMVLGTTYLQGPSSCVKEFAISHVESGDGFLNDSVDAAGEPVVPQLNVAAPTDIVYPDSFRFIHAEVSPLVKKGNSFSEALEKVIIGKCPSLKPEIEAAFEKSTVALTKKLDSAKKKYAKKKNAKNKTSLVDAEYNLTREKMLDGEVLKVIKSKPKLKAACTNVHPKFERYLSFVHSGIAGKIKYIGHPRKAAIIAHLGEGRRNDPYNMLEFKLLQDMGLAKKNFNLVHAVGVDKSGFKFMAKNGMGLIWSPFSNFLLYGETADILSAHKAGVTIALGSDWTPTGSKSVLEELKIARNYIAKKGLDSIFTDEYLYTMVTENSAKLVNHEENDPTDGKHGMGKVVVDAMANLVVMAERVSNPYTNLVTSETKDINLVVVLGSNKYGNVKNLKQAEPAVKYEKLPAYLSGINQFIEKDSKGNASRPVAGIATPLFGAELKAKMTVLAYAALEITDLVKKFKSELGTVGKAEKAALKEKGLKSGDLTKAKKAAEKELKVEVKASLPSIFASLMTSELVQNLKPSDNCGFKEQKGFVFQDSLTANKSKTGGDMDDLTRFKNATGLNLDRVVDIQKVLGTLLMTQSRNMFFISGGKPSDAPNYYPSLFSCNDSRYTKRLSEFMLPDAAVGDEYENNLDYRLNFRRAQQDRHDTYNTKNPTKKPRKTEPHRMADSYGLEYDANVGVDGY